MILVFTAGEGWTGAVTRWWTWSRAGHVAAEFAGGDYLDATPALGVAAHRRLAGRIVGRYRVCAPAATIRRATGWAALQVGRPYDWSAIYGMAFRRDWHDQRAWFCSELWAAAFEAAGMPLLNAERIDRVTPRDLMMSPLLEQVVDG